MNLPGDPVAEQTATFLCCSSQFRLGELPTEQPHRLTSNLSALAQKDPEQALRNLHRIDIDALNVLWHAGDKIAELAAVITRTLRADRRIFICGCGATGRLALTIETLWLQSVQSRGLRNRVIGFMAGGDAALIRSIERFEDHPEYGARQLMELGFVSGDLLIACTEGGETPFVIGAVQQAAQVSSNAPWFLYCNPDDLLCRLALRSAAVIGDQRIVKMPLLTGPMALAGSTRMQATTVLLAAVGIALFWHDRSRRAVRDALSLLRARVADADPAWIAPFTVAEADVYRGGGEVLYVTDRHCAVTILSDATERSPTFSLDPVENVLDNGNRRSLCHLCLPEASTSADAWRLLLARAPRPLDWPEVAAVASLPRLLGFDFSAAAALRRQAVITDAFRITREQGALLWQWGGVRHRIAVPRHLPALVVQLQLKMLLNMHSTLVMGRLGRFEGNLMTWVRPSCNKLIDRAIRYCGHLLAQRSLVLGYEQLAEECFAAMVTMRPDQSLVMAVVERVCARHDR